VTGTPSSDVHLPAEVALALRRERGALRVLRADGAILTILALVIVLLLAAVGSGGVPFALAVAFALLPVPLVAALLLRADRFEPEPTRAVVRTFLWGAGAAVVLAVVFSTVVSGATLALAPSWGDDVAGAVIAAPITEEFAKGLALLFLVRRKRGLIDGVQDGILYAAWAGLGFAMTENVLYYADAYVEGGFAIGVGLAIVRRSGAGGIVVLVGGGYLGAVLLHALWNASAVLDGSGRGFLLLWLIGYLPLTIVGGVLLAGGVRRERRIVTDGLRPELERGTLTEPEYAFLHGPGRARTRLRRRARRTGREARRLLHVYEAAAYELAHANLDGTRGRERLGGAPLQEACRRALVEARAALAGVAPDLLPR
jgi:RsiW-degrading membrane proteinase PrsW (M82 family)